ncbi:phosphatidate cytidylyltransferase [Shimia gijangensis]|uniref:Phosphatidate cytidylyltransferase n=1 Tax=Shimia gijangensis TaxID=1470563 RepID=A0A1M6HVR3_9RHOB|nr:phosphatidate cytidylyltransferase [Shimia gijangensis]SHJ26187.1 phosphatidate cytidylyltransferase [Shimia gijangensis]
MSGASGKWGDLGPRLVSAFVMVVVGVVEVWLGGNWFHGLVAVVGGGMIWELTRMMSPNNQKLALPLGILCAVILFVAPLVPQQAMLPILLAPAVVGATQISKDRLIYAAYSSALMLACLGLMLLRDFNGIRLIVWLVLVVIATDVAGYFVGRIVGGPKFWPKVSPKKTWSGTIGGWVAAACVGAAFGGFHLIVISVLTSFSSQMGDAAESAIKRRTGVKDSSNLIPGHGGFLDRFDAMMGAALFVMVVGLVVGLPAGQ